jgi:iron(III) transport system substrate-binding protein
MASKRSRFLVLAGAALAAGATPAWAAGPAWQSQWSDLTAAAKKEGKLSALTAVGLGFRKWMEAAEQALGIEIDLQQQNSSPLIATKLLTERGANLYDIDMIVMTPTEAIPRLLPVGALDKIRPMIFRPDAMEGKGWRGGLAWAGDGFGFPLSETVIMGAVDTNQVHPGEMKNARSWLDPKWKGKIILADFRSTTTRVLMTSIRLRDGDDAVKRLMIDQNPTFVTDLRQQAEGLVRGTYAIAQGLTAPQMAEFTDAGIGKNVAFVDIPDITYVSYTLTLWAVNKAPHPNATKLFANWAMTKEGQKAFTDMMKLNARRAEIPLVDPTNVARPGQWYLKIKDEALIPEVEKTRAVMTKIMGQPA